MSTDFLQQIVEYKRGLLQRQKTLLDVLKKKSQGTRMRRYHIFKTALTKPGTMNLIAEIKKASPSKGLICESFDALGLARTYVDNGAAAISVLTEDKFFLGKMTYLRQVVDNFNVPVLMKDFILDEAQIYEAFSYGAAAVLLIVAILSDEELRHLLKVAASLDVDCLVEVHDEEELTRALAAGAGIIGINNRNLRTFEVDTRVSEQLIPRIPSGKVIVVESGIKRHEQVVKFKTLGAHAVLIGETFLLEKDVGKKVREVMVGKQGI